MDKTKVNCFPEYFS